MKTLIKTISLTIGVLALLAGAGYYFFTQNSTSGGEITKVADKIEEREEKEGTPEKSGTEEEDADMTEVDLQILLHQMTHQKISAGKKKGAVEMTQENIDGLLLIVQANKHLYEHGPFYEDALTEWQQGDFSNSVTVHNTIWDWHKGTVGRATGLMSAEEEQEFVERHFR